MPERKNCRSYYRELRNSLSKETVQEKSRMICHKILDSQEYRLAQVILGYYPLGNEVDCRTVLKQGLAEGKRIALPKTAGNGQMDFYEIHSMNDVEEGMFHVMEPKSDCAILLPCEEMSSSSGDVLVLVPGVVFDKGGNRYGYGKGYYDRYFARFPKLKRMALAYTEQITDERLISLDTDVKMHMIITDIQRIDGKRMQL